MKYFSLMCLIVFFAQSEVSVAEGKYLIVKGNILNQVSVPEAQRTMCNEKNIVCMNSYYRYTIKVEESLSGDSPKIIEAASYQHGGRYYRNSDEYAFVLEPITDDRERRKLGANYIVEEQVFQTSEFCFQQEIKTYVSANATSFEALKNNCVDSDMVFSKFKWKLMAEMENSIWDELEATKYYIDGYHIDIDKSGKLYLPDDKHPEICSEDELDTYDLDIWEECSPWRDDIEVVEFVLTKGAASEVMEMIEKKVNGLPFSGVSSEISLTTESRHDILRWTYEVITL